jgi:hypothetical protein
LAEGSVAAREIALEGLLASVDVGVLFQILGEGEALEADDTYVLLNLLVRCHVSSQGEPGGVGLATVGLGANIGSFHVVLSKYYLYNANVLYNFD